MFSIIGAFFKDLFGLNARAERAEKISRVWKLWKQHMGTLPFGVNKKGEFLKVSYEEEVKNLLILGNPGSGKSLLLNTVVSQTVCVNHAVGSSRAIIFDVKGDQEVLLKRHDIDAKILNPLKTEFSALSLASLIRNETDAEDFALTLCQTTKEDVAKGEDRYWKETTKNIFQTIIFSLVQRVHKGEIDEFTYRDIFNAIALITFNEQGTLELDDLMTFLSPLPQKDREYVRANLEHPKNGSNHYSSLMAIVQDWKIIAARDSHATERLTIEDWDGVWLLGFDETAKNLLDPLNRFILNKLMQHCMMLPDKAQDRAIDATYFIIDEGLLMLLSIIDGLDRLMEIGRSKGIRVFLTLLNLSKAREIVGDDALLALLSYFRSIVVTGISYEDAVFLTEHHIGYHTVVYTEPIVEWEYTYSVTVEFEDEPQIITSPTPIARTDHRFIKKERRVVGTKKEERQEPIVRPEDLAQIPPPDKDGSTAFFYRPGEIAQIAKITPEMLEKECPVIFQEDNLRPIPLINKSNPAHFEIKPWTDQERAKFGLAKRS
ncbi:type IV secretion system DNA-binding domain-containing protein [Pleurocapsales cyanobacterium LEGE 10410]|nr:type IV secretion system DNA-binding domain-containing protein [Pleurocapsales cyanobacterium LEGE 10410]